MTKRTVFKDRLFIDSKKILQDNWQQRITHVLLEFEIPTKLTHVAKEKLDATRRTAVPPYVF